MCTTCMSIRPWTDDCIYTGLGETRAVITEGADAASNTSTAYRIDVGDSFNGSYGTSSDTDWVRIDLVAGTTYTFGLSSTVSGVDPYLYVYNSAGIRIASDDDGGAGVNSQLTFTATTTGAYYLEASRFAIATTSATGSYTLTTTSGGPVPTGVVWTPAQMATQLTTGFWQASGQDTRSFDIPSTGTISVNFNAISADMRTLAQRALDAWTDTTGIQFVQTTGTASITFVQADRGAFASSVTDFAGNILSSTVNIDQNWLDVSGTGFNTYSYQTYLHEIGHAIGLGHAGNYNGSATYGFDNSATNDSWQLTLMSYFDQNQNTSITASRAYTITPMIADLLAIEQLYGPISVRTGNTTYGEGSNAGAVYAMFSQFNTDGDESNSVTMTVIDSGGFDSFDFRSDIQNQRIDLRSAATSDVYGDLGTLIVAQGTVIEQVLAGSGNDVVIGNEAANTLMGNLGNDNLAGNDGNDSLHGGDGTDTVNGGAGDDFLFGGATTADVRDAMFGGDGNDSLDGGAGNDDLNGGNGIDTVIGGLGSDTVIGNAGNDLLAGSGGSDLIFGNDGNDTVNGGFGFDRLNGGAGADSFIHAGVADHGSDWIQDYSGTAGDGLTIGLAGAAASQFQVNFASTTGAGDAGVQEAFIIYRPTGQILWALVDGAGQSSINVNIGGQAFDLLA